ncbi:general transcription factor II-I repeat domain-containing protein 2-like [Macrobrachium rosenbergii]|uniref:general transcription factor II-I repeat domain-containing protein 2-like n=1 Tax=Macrobrachium rosenbergii TaxID=79674 RepID=UPI0034D3F8FE
MVREIRLTPHYQNVFVKRRKVDTECRVFQEKWTQYYLFTEVNTKPVCLVCNQQVSVLKEYNIRRHYETHHEEKYHHLQGQLRKEKINELLTGLKKQQSAFTRSREVSDAAVKASYLIANELVQASKPFSDGEFVKTCMLKAAEVVYPEKRPAFAYISLSRNTVADRVEDLSGDLGRQMNDKIKSFIAFSVAIDESTDVTDVAQLAIFIRGVDETLTITEEFLELVPMKDTTTANDIFSSLIRVLDKAGVDWSRAVSLATDGAPSMVGRKGRKKVVTQYYENIRSFKLKLSLWETQLSNGDTSHFPCLTAMHVTGLNADLDQYKDKITGLLQEFERRFQIFSEPENEFAFFRSPFTVKASDMPADIQLAM